MRSINYVWIDVSCLTQKAAGDRERESAEVADNSQCAWLPVAGIRMRGNAEFIIQRVQGGRNLNAISATHLPRQPWRAEGVGTPKKNLRFRGGSAHL